MLPSFPEDIYEAIFKDFKGDKQNLLAMTAVCRLFCILGQRYLFSNIILQAEGDIDTVPSIPPSRCIKLESILRINPDIALNVRSIKLRQSLGAFNESGTRCRLRCYSPGTEHPYLPWITKNGPFLAHILRLLSRGRIASLSFDSTPPCSWEDLDQQLHHALLCIFRSPHFEELTITGLHNIPFTLLYQCPNTRRLELSDSTFNFSVNPQTHTLRMNCNPPRLSRLCVSLQQSNKTRILELLETGLGLDLSELDYMRLNFSNSLDLQNTKLSQLKELHIHYEGIAPSMNAVGLPLDFSALRSLVTLTLSIDGSAHIRDASFKWLVSTISSLSSGSAIACDFDSRLTRRNIQIGIIIDSAWFPCEGLDLFKSLSIPLSNLFKLQDPLNLDNYNPSKKSRLRKVLIVVSILQVRKSIIPDLELILLPFVSWKGCTKEMLEVRITGDVWFK